MKRKKLILLLGLAVVLIGIVFLFSKNRNGFITAQKTTVENVVVKKTVSASGVVKSVNEVDLAFSITGVLNKVNVIENEYVEKGAYLATLSNYDTYQSSEKLRHTLESVKKDRELFVESYETNLQGFGGKDEYNIELRRQNDLVSKAEADYQSSLGSLSKTTLKAPFDGTVVEVKKEVGEVATAGEDIFLLADLSELILEIELDQEDFGQIKKGLLVEVSLDAYQGETFEGFVDDLPTFANRSTDDFTVKIKLTQNPRQPILLGMKGDADIVVSQTTTEVSSLTFDVIFSEDEKQYVWISDNGMLEKKYIETGLEGDLYTELKTDLSAYTLVVPNDTENLEIGKKVKIE